MSGFNFEVGRSNNMLDAEERGMLTAGRWGRLHGGFSATAVVAVMRPSEAHHTGTGRRGKSRLTPVLDGDVGPTAEQTVAMRAFDAGDRPRVQGAYLKFESARGPYGRKRWIPTVGLFVGDEAAARKLKEFEPLDDAALAVARQWEGKDITVGRHYYRAARRLADAPAETARPERDRTPRIQDIVTSLHKE